MDTHRQDLRRGFNWLGGAMAVAKVTDFGTMLLVLLYLTKQQVGIAAVVVAVGTVIEALDGLGTSAALVQAPSLSRLQLDAVFWYVMGSALLVAVATLLAAPWIGAFFGLAGMAYFLPVALKQPLVGAAVIPLSIMSRDLQYERIATVNVCSTLAAAATRIGLAVAGAGAWSIVVANAASGLYTLVGAWLARPFRPRLRFSLAAISPLARFGVRAMATTLFEQLLNNLHYLLVGWLYGTAPLAVYRVAFDIAMQPALAVGTLVNRAALPVFARVAAVREHLAQALAWSLRRLAAVVAPLAAATLLAAGPVTALLHDARGRTYSAAAVPLALLAAAALPRVISQLLYPLVLGCGRPSAAVRLSAVTLLLLTAGMLIAGAGLPARPGIVAISAVWLCAYPLLILWELRYLRRQWDIRAGELARTLALPVGSAAALVSIAVAARLAMRDGDPWLRIGWILAAAALTGAGLFLRARRRETPDEPDGMGARR